MNKNKVSGAIILIAIGVFLFLKNLGYIDFNIFVGILDLWPLILIVIGVNMLFNKKKVVPFVTWIAFFIILILYSVFYQNINIYNFTGNAKAELVQKNIDIEKDSKTSYGEFELDIGASKVDIGSEEEKLISTHLKSGDLTYSESYENNKEIAILKFENKDNIGINFGRLDNDYNFNLNEDIIWDLDFDLGAISGKFDLIDVPIRTLDLDLGAANLDVILGNERKESFINIDSGASNLNIVIPKDAGIKIKLDGALTATNIDDLNLNKLGDYYISSNYEDTNTKLEFDIEMGAGKIDFEIR